MAALIEKFKENKIPNIIISKDIYPLQLTAIYPYTSYLYPIKQRGGIDMSVMIPINEKENYRFLFWNLVSQIRKINPSDLYNISPVNFPILSAMNRFNERGIKSLINIKTAVKYIEKIVGNTDRELFMELLYNDEEISNSIPLNIIESRLKALDVKYMLPIYQQDPEYLSIRIENLIDNETLNKINSKFFTNNPMDFNNL
jgi:hypothetical protein